MNGFIVRRGGVSASGKFGIFSVSFPVGSTCYITNGTKTINAPADAVALGRYNFPVPEAGAWTATCTDGTNTRSSSPVTFSAEYQYESVTLSYSHYIFEEGVGLADGFSITNIEGHAEVGADKILRVTQVDAEGSYHYFSFKLTPTISIPGSYTTLKIELEHKAVSVWNQVGGFYTGDPSDTGAIVARLNTGEVDTRYTVTIDLSSSGDFYLGFYAKTGTDVPNLTIYNIWLE